MKRITIIISILLLGLAILCYYIFLKKEFSEYKTFTSPDKNLKLIVYIESNPYSLSFNSDLEYRMAYVELIDKNNKTLVKPSLFSNCNFVIGDLNVSWDTINKVVYYNKFDSIDLKQMKMTCN
ncbi:conserved hypothetical protein [Flavobacterium sp. 9AF]|uniref:hypothetical protein n=1 Tax=Flavobacterium sp. 9AF TaxID=2653142 RepID=UPI0012F45DA8|nr:hypothetical protein [Flavobacterium sp. 9AF]VXC01569.1 conserved hypothetical protein [Flavobacterium sp. 9AF]